MDEFKIKRTALCSDGEIYASHRTEKAIFNLIDKYNNQSTLIKQMAEILNRYLHNYVYYADELEGSWSDVFNDHGELINSELYQQLVKDGE